MKKYLLISAIFAVIISITIYSIVYIPEVSTYFTKLTETKTDEQFETSPEPIVNLIDTLPNLSITSGDNFKSIQFGDLKLKINSEYRLSESAEKINLKIDENNYIDGFFYPLVSTPRKDIQVEEFESSLLKNTYSLAKKSNIPDSFLSEVFNLGNGSEVKDSIGGKEIVYQVADVLSFRNYNSGGYFFTSTEENRYKFIVITTKKLYIFNIKVEQINYLKMLKTFYNLEYLE